MKSAKTGEVLNKEYLSSEDVQILGYFNLTILQALVTVTPHSIPARKKVFTDALDKWRLSMYALRLVYKNNPDRQSVFSLPGLDSFRNYSIKSSIGGISTDVRLKDLIDYAYKVNLAYYVDGIALEGYEQTALKAAMKEIQERGHV